MKKITIIYMIFASLLLTNGQLSFSGQKFRNQLKAYGRLQKQKRQLPSGVVSSKNNTQRKKTAQKAQKKETVPVQKSVNNRPKIQNDQEKVKSDINDQSQEKKGWLARIIGFQGLNPLIINFILNRVAKNAEPEEKEVFGQLLAFGISLTGITSFFSDDPLVSMTGSVLFNGVQNAIISALFSQALSLCGQGVEYIDSKLSPTGIPHKFIGAAKSTASYIPHIMILGSLVPVALKLLHRT